MSRLLPMFIAVFALCVAGCKTDSESALAEVTDKQKDLVKILKGVTDKDSAMAAKTKILGIAKEMSELAAKMDKKKSNDAEMTKAAEKYKPEMEKASKDLQAEMLRIEKIPGAMEPIFEGLMGLGAGGMGMGIPGVHP